ncbi:hypothetical protein L917_17095 [Phytophthora nicotianae]|nr:hypothetical protein L915_17370 [Phytophthora nicotianae]ETL29596.1 hypothetical protein L916_17262 [Phytophthora nicotianae]ETL82817.1 hypothetical protein L917_17095 [Phytophthora nicotianae]ETM36054.1 hypothetical protein L914_17165 [Phytophthora nicotianae]
MSAVEVLAMLCYRFVVPAQAETTLETIGGILLTTRHHHIGINAIRSLYMCEVAGLRNDACLFLDETKQDPEQLQAFSVRMYDGSVYGPNRVLSSSFKG